MKDQAPLSALLFQNQTSQLLNKEYVELMHAIENLGISPGQLAICEDLHSKMLAELLALLSSGKLWCNVLLLDKIEFFVKNCKSMTHYLSHPNAQKDLTEIQLALDACITTINRNSHLERVTVLPHLQQLRTMHAEILSLLEQQTLEERLATHPPRAHLSSVEGNCYSVEQEAARRLLCKDLAGDAVKENEYGNSAVFAARGVHYKPEGGSLNPIAPGYEYAAAVLQQLIAPRDTLIAAPTTLLRITDVPVQRIENGVTHSAKLHGLIQAGLTIDGICLEDMLHLLDFGKYLFNALGKQSTIQIIDHLLSVQPIYRTEAETHYNLSEEHSLDQIAQAFEQWDQEQPTTQRLREYQSGTPEERAADFKRVFNKANAEKRADLVTLLGLLKTYPHLATEQSLAKLSKLPKLMRYLPQFFPDLTTEAILEILPEFWQRFLNTKATSSLLISQLLVQPADAKADNFMLQLKYDPNGRLMKKSCSIVGIDNDAAFIPPVSRHGDLQCHDCQDRQHIDTVLPQIKKQQYCYWLLYNQFEKHWVFIGFDRVAYKTVDEVVSPEAAHPLCRELANLLDSRQGAETINDHPELHFKLLRTMANYLGQHLHEVDIKNTLLCIPEIMEQPIEPDVIKQFLSTPPTAHFLQWLGLLARRNCQVEQWQQQGVDCSKIDLPLTLPQSVLALIEQRWQQLYDTLQHNPQLTHQQLFEITAPIEAAIYAKIRQKAPTPLIAQQLIYDKKAYQRCVEEQLTEKQLVTPLPQGGTLLQHLQQMAIPKSATNTQVNVTQRLFDTLQQIDWTSIKKNQRWHYVQAFTLLPNLRLEHWQGETPEILSPLIQSWLEGAVQYARPFVAQYMLDLGASVSACNNDAQQTVLHTLCRIYPTYPDSHTVDLMARILLTHHSCQPNQYNAMGYTPLLQWINSTQEPEKVTEECTKSADILLDILITHGAHLEAKDTPHDETLRERIYDTLFPKKGAPSDETRLALIQELSKRYETVLDKTLKPNSEKITWFTKLVQKGAGMHASMTRLMPFWKKMKSLLDQHRELGEAFELLKARNVDFRWQLSLPILAKKASRETNTRILGVEQGEVYLPGFIQKKLLTAEQKFDEESEAKTEHGRRVVLAVDYQNAQWHIKEYPEIPGIELAVGLLSRMLFGVHTPPNQLFSFFDQKNQAYPVLISQTIPGDNLHDLLELISPRQAFSLFQSKPRKTNSSSLPSPKDKQQAIKKLKRLDPQTTSEQITLAMLIHPEDGKPDNYQLSPINPHDPNTRYRLMGVDNDHAFVKAVVENNGKRELQVKSVLFCLENMRKSIHPHVRQRLLSVSPETLLMEWLTHLNEYQHRASQLFSEVDQDRFYKGISYLRAIFTWQREQLPTAIKIPFPPKAITALLDRFKKLQFHLHKDPSITHLRLLTKMSPLVGYRYDEAFQNHEAPLDILQRFDNLFEQSYSQSIKGRHKTLSSTRDLVEKMGASKKQQANFHDKTISEALSWTLDKILPRRHFIRCL